MNENEKLGWYPILEDDLREKGVELKRDEEKMEKVIMAANDFGRKMAVEALERKLEYSLHQPYDDVPSNRRDSFLKIATKRRRK